MSNQTFRVEQLDDVRWIIPQEGNMKVPGIIYTNQDPSLTDEEIEKKVSDPLEQVCNVAQLPGIIEKSIAEPDFHLGYGFVVGGVAAFDSKDGIVSPGGVGYDINCGVRLMITGVSIEDGRDRVKGLVDGLFNAVPCGLNSNFLKITEKELEKVATEGATWAVEQGYGTAKDIQRIESYGKLAVHELEMSARAISRGRPQLGSLGSGNHFLELGYIAEVFDEELAKKWQLGLGKMTIMIHTGSRGFGHQICDDFLLDMYKDPLMSKIYLPDKQLVYAPLGSDMANRYLNAMGAAANFAFANRQIIMDNIHKVWDKHMRGLAHADQFRLLYDVAHNLAQFEAMGTGDDRQEYLIHRKGATRALPPYHSALPREYLETGQPVLIPGSMQTSSYVLVGMETGKETFYSTCHGAGRLMSRKKAKEAAKGRAIEREMGDQGIHVRHVGQSTLKEEHGGAYKDVSNVVDIVERAGIARKVARISPVGVVKG
jgi:tRNA-splicing ligase RtcB (3'-phosphate/5'-hydroxy nucleic acid ligase)